MYEPINKYIKKKDIILFFIEKNIYILKKYIKIDIDIIEW